MKVARVLATISAVSAEAYTHGYLRNGLVPQEKVASSEDQFLRTLFSTRTLQTPYVPQRQCDEVITIVRKEETILLAETLLEAMNPGLGDIFRDPLQVAFQRSFNYDVQVRVICSTCLEAASIFTASPDFDLSGTGRFGFQEYCGPGRHGSDVIHSALLLSPVYPGTDVVVQGILNGGIFFHGTLTDETACPTEFYPTNLTKFIEEFDGGPVGLINAVFNVISGTLAAASGAITIIPDYLGFGQGTFSQGGARKSFVVKNLYAQAAVVAWLKAKDFYNKEDCTELSNTVTVGGYSEGGYAVFAAGEALADLGAEVLEIRTGGAPIRIGQQFQWTLEQFDFGSPAWLLDVVVPFGGHSYSSTNPDLPNSDLGQDMLAPEVRDDILTWFEDSITFGEVQQKARALSTPPGMNFTPSLLRPQVVDFFRDATRQNVMNPCSLAIPDTDVAKLCEAVIDNELVDDFEATTIPTVICHSENDDVVTIDNLPDLAANPDYLSRFNLLGIQVNVGHITSGIPCVINMVAPFTRLFQSDPKIAHRIEEIDNPACTGTNTQPGRTCPGTGSFADEFRTVPLARQSVALSKVIYQLNNTNFESTDDNVNPLDLATYEPLFFRDTGSTEVMIVRTRNDNPRRILVVFRGTDDSFDNDWFTNIDQMRTQFGPPNNKINFTVPDRSALGRTVQREIAVHRGFNDALFSANLYEELRESIMTNREEDVVYFAGHSLGGANAQLMGTFFAHFHPEINVYITTLGQPRVGNIGFKRFAERMLPNLNVFRLVNNFDVVPRVPAEYDHTGHLIWRRADERVDGVEAYYLQTGNRSLGYAGITDFSVGFSDANSTETEFVGDHATVRYLAWMDAAAETPEVNYTDGFLLRRGASCQFTEPPTTIAPTPSDSTEPPTTSAPTPSESTQEPSPTWMDLEDFTLELTAVNLNRTMLLSTLSDFLFDHFESDFNTFVDMTVADVTRRRNSQEYRKLQDDISITYELGAAFVEPVPDRKDVVSKEKEYLTDTAAVQAAVDKNSDAGTSIVVESVVVGDGPFPTEPPREDTTDDNNTSVIVGAVIGGVAVLALLVIGVLVWRSRRESNQLEMAKNNVMELKPEAAPDLDGTIEVAPTHSVETRTNELQPDRPPELIDQFAPKIRRQASEGLTEIKL